MVTVAATHTFEYRGQTYRRGDLVDMTPIEAALHARKGHVSLAKVTRPIHTAAIDPEPEPAPPPRCRRYRRRDMVAEP